MNNQPQPAPSFAPVKRSKGGIDYNAPFAAEMMKEAVYNLRPMKPESYCLSVLAASFWDSSTANGVIHPEMERTCVSLSVTTPELLDIAHGMTQTLSLEQLEAGERPDWAIHYDDSGESLRILSYQPLFLETVRQSRAQLKRLKIAINYIKTMSRYNTMKAGLAKGMSIYAASKMNSNYNDLGFSEAERVKRGSAPYQIWYTDREGVTKGTKLQHNPSFNHEMLRDRTPAGYAKLADVRILTEEMVRNPSTAGMTFKEISKKFLLNDDFDAMTTAISDINDFGWLKADLRKIGNDPSRWYVLFTPLLPFHQFAWSLDLINAGPLLTRFEVANGFIPFADDTEQGDDPMRFAPPLGYHYLYGIRSARSGEFVTVGQTTTSLMMRRESHERAGSNSDANDAILSILADPDDHLEIVHFATVHHIIASKKEMALANAMLTKGHNIKNKILTVQKNNNTVKLDSKFGTPEFIKRNWWAVQEKLDLVKEAHEGKEILFMIDSLPEVPTPEQPPIGYEAVHWLFEPVAYLVPDEDDDSAYETRTHDDLM